jgi:DNA transposition AAA+ family ATPase
VNYRLTGEAICTTQVNMTLGEYLEQSGMSRAAFARQIGVREFSVTRYCAGRVPEARVMERIMEATAGKVSANDFFRQAA